MKIGCVFASGDIVGEGPVWHREQECFCWTDFKGLKTSREKGERAMERLLARTSKDF